MKSFWLPDTLVCPACGTTLSGAINTTGDREPEDGDPTICVVCRALLVYAGAPAASLRYPTDEEQRAFLADPAVQRGIHAIAEYHRQGGPV